ncbi:MAG TPA: carboxyl transferase domain-containing protein [Chitinophagales bacterium]|nr:carboxyl transferase domain-containing protein [Chitinophagales bacterium]HMW11996.1 carboxyl transferase domain-containing protein [Chitinophagales bacterium]HMX59674.1 carboxyl transferase domain-containing protein [Chitinophagales bacterium]HMY22706.1 carboxyl transferase domain-containing protein [Chitinophagales bacterium]HMZ33139.1 carboxyl transferase domain-containing protein [Chitinophagales bacterium]
MSILQTKINTNSAAYKDNYQKMLSKIEEMNKHLKQSLFQGEEKHISKAKSQGKLLARERIEMLLDQDSPFLELCPLAGLGVKGGFGTGGTMVAGIGFVSNKMCMITANVGTNKGGAIDIATLKKAIRISEIASENNLPCINLVESAGANLPDQAQVFNLGGNNFKNITRHSKKGLPTISIVFGNSTAGGAYIPGMSDYTIFIKDKAKVFLAGPPLVKMATNEIVDDETLGGAEMHSKISGVSDYLAQDELDGIRIARELMSNLNLKSEIINLKSEISYKEPNYPIDELLGIVSVDVKIPFDCREVIARIVDGSEFHEFKKEYGTTLVCGFAKIHGYSIAIIGNNGVLFNDTANKGAHFIQLCNMNHTPILFLQNITGFMVGKQYEQNGIIKDGAKMINAVSNSEVPMFTLMMGASYGAGNYAMCGRAYNPRFLFSYPNSMIAVMGAEQLAGVMQMVSKEAAIKSGQQYDEAQATQMKEFMKAEIEKQSNAFFASGQLWDDGIIDPRDTRNVLGLVLALTYMNEVKGTSSYGVYRM